MRAVTYEGVGGPEVIRIRDIPRPMTRCDSLLVRVHASALNRGDLLQRQGEYRIPKGQSTIPGVEIAGTVEECGADVTGFAVGERVFGVVEGGGFAEYCLLDAGMANRIPDSMEIREA